MSDKFDVIVVGCGHMPLIGTSLSRVLNENRLVIPYDPNLMYSEEPIDWEALTKQLDTLIAVAFRRSFRERHEGRIERYQRRQPRRPRTLFEWNRKIKWQPRFFSAPSRKQHFSQSRLRLSQVLSLAHPTIGRLHRVSSRGLLSL